MQKEMVHFSLPYSLNTKHSFNNNMLPSRFVSDSTEDLGAATMEYEMQELAVLENNVFITMVSPLLEVGKWLENTVMIIFCYISCFMEYVM